MQTVSTNRPAPALLLVVDGAEVLATVPADAHLDLDSVIDSGIEFDQGLIGNSLNLRLPAGE